MSRNTFFLTLLAVVTMIPQMSHAATPRSGPSVCNVSMSELFLRRGDRNFVDYLEQVSSYFADAAAVGPTGKVARPVVSSDALTLRIEVEKSGCVALDRSAGLLAPNGMGGCDFIGCLGTLDPEFNSLPNGSTVKISTCGGGMKMTGSFFKNSEGAWVMTSYSETMVSGPEDCPVPPE